jgi:hypothetical protein
MMGDRMLIVSTHAASLTTDAPSFSLFEQGTFDVVERLQVPVFRKRPMVVEELVITHEVVDRQMRIHTTLRSHDVAVKSIDRT